MKRVLPFTLSFFLVLFLGFIAESMSMELFYEAKMKSVGQPPPPITEWIFDVFAVWSNGSILCIFLLPWVLLLLYALLGSQEGGSLGRDIRLMYGFLSFAIAEGILFVFFTSVSLLPFFELWKGFSPKAPLSAYVPHLFLGAGFLGVIVAAVRRAILRCRRGSGDERQS